MSGNTTNLGKNAQTGKLIADEVRSNAMVVAALTVTGNIETVTENVAGTLSANAISVTTDIGTATLTASGAISGLSAGITNAISSGSFSSGSGTITNTITAKSFSQPKQVVGSAASPSATVSQAYSTSFTKYIFYFAVPNNTQFNQTFSITGFPDAFFASNSAVYDATFVATGPWSVGGSPITTADLYADENTNTLNVNIVTPVATPPVFTGTCYVKVVISFSVD